MRILVPLLVAVGLLVTACGGGDASTPESSSSGGETPREPAPAAAPAAQQPEPAPVDPNAPNAHVVVAVRGATAEEAHAALERYRVDGGPTHGDYPRVLDASAIDGLGQGFALVVAEPGQEAVAAALVEFLHARGWQEARATPLRVSAPEALRVVVVRPAGAPETPHEWRYVGPVRLVVGNAVLGAARPTDDNRLVVPFVAGDEPAGGVLVTGGDAEHPYECPEWRVPAPGPNVWVLEVDLPLSTVECMEHG